MTRITCSEDILARTIEALQTAGRRSEERGVLWLAAASATSPTVRVEDVYEPTQNADVDFFHSPASSLRELMANLRRGRRKVVAQVHSHPGRAFHSEADDKWAIVRHAGALSLVLPRFAALTTPANFLDQATVYELSDGNEWVRVPARGDAGRVETQR